MNKKYIIGFFVLSLLVACVPQIDEFESTAGTADFTTYVALGNSLTAGFADNALYAEGQINSFPNMLAAQFKKVGMQGEFVQPMMPAGLGVGVGATGYNTKYILGVVNQSLTPIPADPNPDQATLQAQILTPVFVDQGPFNNFGVPGAKAAHLLAPGYGNIANLPAAANPYFVRFASSTGTSVVIDAMNRNPSFFTLWIGNNDVLSYATSGGVGDVITPVNDFTTYYTLLIGTLTGNGAKGAVANIPNITDIPFFTTVPYNGLVLTDPNDVSDLNDAYDGTGITFQLGQNPFVIADASVPVIGMRQMQAGELVLLTALTDIRANGWGSQIPIPDAYTLNTDEVNQIEAAIAGYNTAIANIANTNDLALVNMNTYLETLKTGLMYDGLGVNADFVTGGAFSLDGVHLNPRGYAIVANFFIDAINAKYNAMVPKVNVTDYEGVKFP